MTNTNLSRTSVLPNLGKNVVAKAKGNLTDRVKSNEVYTKRLVKVCQGFRLEKPYGGFVDRFEAQSRPAKG
jgi:hypothetical protein